MKAISKYTVKLVRESQPRYNITDKIADSSAKAKELLDVITCWREWHNEKFGMLCLDSQNNVIGYHIITEGTVNETFISGREVAVRALLNNASAVMLFHNHLGGSRVPSQADLKATECIYNALKTLNIRLLDHIILLDDPVSMAERGDLPKEG